MNKRTVISSSIKRNVSDTAIANAISSVAEARKQGKLNSFKNGDTVHIYTKTVNPGRKRVQVYTGKVIACEGTGTQQRVTVNWMQAGEQQELTLDMHTPNVSKDNTTIIKVVRSAKLPFLQS